MAKSLNKVTLIGNLTRDPELRYTPQGTAVCTFSLATNRQWTTDSGEKKEDAEFHRVVAWNKLAEICSQLLKKGRKVYVEGRLQTRSWQGQDGQNRYTTEVVISDMILLDSKREGGELGEDFNIPDSALEPSSSAEASEDEAREVKKVKKSEKAEEVKEPEESEDIPF
jgi:single-strand DNA-binding protein